MNAPGPTPPAVAARRDWRLGLWLTLSVGILLLALLWLTCYYYPRQLGPVQPVPFSHRVHAGDKQIGCLLCHDGAARGAAAGIPPLQTCLLCHERIAITYPPIRTVREHYAAGVPIAWQQVYDLPDFVYFDHAAHVRQGVDCGRCHGDVRALDRIVKDPDPTMGFCVQCHRDNQVSRDCLTCHR